MEEIKVGEYVRTDNGFIGKINKIDKRTFEEFAYSVDNTSFEKENGGWNYIFACRIKKHSFNIIDLIEVGDICIIDDDCCLYIYDESFIRALEEDIRRGSKLMSVLTRQQYENNCYRLENENETN